MIPNYHNIVTFGPQKRAPVTSLAHMSGFTITCLTYLLTGMSILTLVTRESIELKHL